MLDFREGIRSYTFGLRVVRGTFLFLIGRSTTNHAAKSRGVVDTPHNPIGDKYSNKMIKHRRKKLQGPTGGGGGEFVWWCFAENLIVRICVVCEEHSV